MLRGNVLFCFFLVYISCLVVFVSDFSLEESSELSLYCEDVFLKKLLGETLDNMLTNVQLDLVDVSFQKVHASIR